MSGPIRANDVDQLATASRNGFVENRFFGSAVVVDSSGVIIAGAGDPAAGGYGRSAWSPSVVTVSLRREDDIAGAVLAMGSGSNSGTPCRGHTAAATLAPVGLSSEHLQRTAAGPRLACQVSATALEMAT